jgi:hypothetical protein
MNQIIHITNLLQLEHEDLEYSFFYSMSLRKGFKTDIIVFAAIEHDDQTNLWQGIICILCSSAVTTYLCFVADLQLIEHDGHNPSAADLQLIRAERLPNLPSSPRRGEPANTKRPRSWWKGIVRDRLWSRWQSFNIFMFIFIRFLCCCLFQNFV